MPLLEDGAKAIPLMRYAAIVGWAIVDDADHARLSKHRWAMLVSGRTSYAYRQQHIAGTTSGNEVFYMHREVLGLPRGTGHGVVVDHIDRNGLNDRCGNLRTVTSAENSQRAIMPAHNTSGTMGVSYQQPRPATKRRTGTTGHWVSQLYRNGVYVHRSSHPTKEAAIAARLQAEADYAARSEGLAS